MPITRVSNFRSPGFLFSCAALLSTVGVLFFLIPYATGYFNEEKSLWVLMENTISTTRGEWEHCYLVPLAVGFLIFLARKDLAALEARPYWPGLVVLILGMLFFMAGRLAELVVAGYFGFQLLLMGAVLFLFGRAFFTRIFFALAFLVFAWPLPFLEAPLAFPLRMIMSDAAVNLLNLVGLPTIKSGTAIVSAPVPALHLESGQRFAVDVADPCSGIRSLFALTMIAALYAYFAVKPMWKQFIVFACAIPLAILGNLLRILMLTFGTIAFGTEFAIGKDALEEPSWFHMAAGYVVFIVALGGLLAIGSLIQADWRKVWGRSKSSNNPPTRPLAVGPEDVY